MTNILITGCSSGIGLETALFLNKQNIKVYASARDENDVKILPARPLQIPCSVGALAYPAKGA